MFVPIDFSPATVVIALLIAGLVALAVRRIATRGLCDCKDHCGDSEGGSCSACHGCDAANSMVEKMNQSLRQGNDG